MNRVNSLGHDYGSINITSVIIIIITTWGDLIMTIDYCYVSSTYVYASRGAGVPPFRLCSSSIHFLIFCSLLLFPFLIHFTYFLLLSIRSLPTRIASHFVSRREVVGGDRTWV